MQSNNHDPLYPLMCHLYDRHDLGDSRDASRYGSDGAEDVSCYVWRYSDARSLSNYAHYGWMWAFPLVPFLFFSFLNYENYYNMRESSLQKPKLYLWSVYLYSQKMLHRVIE